MHSRLLAFFWLFCAVVHAADISVIEGSASPNGKLAIAVIPQKEGQYIDETEDGVFLVDAVTKKILLKIPNVSSTGGLWGTPTKNVHCAWDRTGKHLIINYRAGRMNGGSIVYLVNGAKLTPISIPEDTSIPKSKILDVLAFNSNGGSEFSWDPDGSLVRYTSGYIPKQGHFDEDYAKYGLPDFDQVLEFVYRFDSKGSLKLIDIRTPKKNAG